MKTALRFLIDQTIKKRWYGSRWIYILARRIVLAYENNDVDMTTNGEYWLQAQLSSQGKVVAIDVGANQGEWTRGLLERCSDCRVYCYEPIPSTFALLQQSVTDSRAILIGNAMSDVEGVIHMHASKDNPYLSSVSDPTMWDPEARSESVDVRAVTGDAEFQRRSIDNLDILKVDAEGHDLSVIKGFSDATATQRIKIIQFEYNSFTLFAGHSLRDFFNLLGENYLLCRLLPAGLEACGYHTSLDDFKQTNWVAVERCKLSPDFVARFNIQTATGLPGIALQQQLHRQPQLLQLLSGRRT
jgi:FkbM family methyltransferase